MKTKQKTALVLLFAFQFIFWVLAINQSEAYEVAPYFYTWGLGNPAYKIKNLMDAKKKAGLKAVTLAFEVASGGCRLNPAVDNMLQDVKAFTTSGGKVIVSFGGAGGTYINETCTTVTALFTQLDAFVSRTKIQSLDFDIEGNHLSNKAANARLITALVKLQSKYPQLSISYTLPVDARTGLSNNSLSILQNSAKANLRVKTVNIMTMDYGYTIPGKDMGDLTIMSAEKLALQLRSIYPGKSNAEIYSTIGITPMIGKNDDGSVFTVSDAQQVASYASKYGIGFISYWAFQRDQVGNVNIDIQSTVNTVDYQFYQIFLKYQ